jgi:hypothetical protein
MHLSNLLVVGTGLIYAWMAYFVTSTDPYATVNHPWQPAVQHLHILVAPFLVFATGAIWRRHVWKSWQMDIRSRRRSGLGLALSLAPMAVSGYLIQTAVEPPWRKAWVVVHLVTAGVWTGGYLLHQFLALWLQARRNRVSRAPGQARIEQQESSPRESGPLREKFRPTPTRTADTASS